MVGIIPKEYKERKKIYAPYLHNGVLSKDAPPEAVEAFKKNKEWFLSQPQ